MFTLFFIVKELTKRVAASQRYSAYLSIKQRKIYSPENHLGLNLAELSILANERSSDTLYIDLRFITRYVSPISFIIQFQNFNRNDTYSLWCSKGSARESCSRGYL